MTELMYLEAANENKMFVKTLKLLWRNLVKWLIAKLYFSCKGTLDLKKILEKSHEAHFSVSPHWQEQQLSLRLFFR